MKKILFLTLMVVSDLLFRNSVQAQEEQTVKAIQSMYRMAEKYQEAKFLGYDVLYRYAAEAKPGEFLDTLRGQFKIQGNR